MVHTKKKSGKAQGMLKIRHVIVLLVVVLVAGLFCAVYYPNQQRSRAAHAAKEIYFDSVQYLVDCSTDKKEFLYDREDYKNYYITDFRKLGGTWQGEKGGRFTAVVDKESRKALYVRYERRVHLFDYTLTAVGVYPVEGSPAKGSARWSKAKPGTRDAGV